MANKPNIVLIFPDQHRGDTMGCVGHPVAKTPNVDRLAAEGVTFTRCVTSSPLCMPARASLMNGQYVNQHGVWNNNLVADRFGPSHVRNIRDAGYHTALFGKTHLYLHQGAGHTNDHIQELQDWGFIDTHELTGPLASAGVGSPYTDYLAQKGMLEAHRELIRTYARGWRRGYIHPWEVPPCMVPTDDHIDVYTGRKAAEWIREYKSDKPFYLQVLFPGPHDPFDSPTEYREMYNPEEMPLGIMEKPAPPVAPYVQLVYQWSRLEKMTPSHIRVMRTYYYGKVSLIDHGVGLVIKALEDKGLLDNTWIIYTSDHGEMLGDHRLSHKIVFYESALKIPCVIRPPRGMKGWKSAALTDHLDIAATLIDIAGARPLGGDGRSLVPQVKAGPGAAGAQKGKEAVFSEVYGFSMVLNDRYKMAVNSQTREVVELYDMATDPNELRNLANDSSMERVKRELLDKYLSQLLSHLDEAKFRTFASMGPEGLEGRRPRSQTGR